MCVSTHRFSPAFCEWRVQFRWVFFLLEEDDAGSREMQQAKQASWQPAAAGERVKGSVTRRAWVLVKQFGPLCVGVCRGCVGGGLVCRNAFVSERATRIPCLFPRQGARLAAIARLACPDPGRHTPFTVAKRQKILPFQLVRGGGQRELCIQFCIRSRKK